MAQTSDHTFVMETQGNMRDLSREIKPENVDVDIFGTMQMEEKVPPAVLRKSKVRMVKCMVKNGMKLVENGQFIHAGQVFTTTIERATQLGKWCTIVNE